MTCTPCAALVALVALDDVGFIAGMSGGSFTALAYRLHGEQLFDQPESRFLHRNEDRLGSANGRARDLGRVHASRSPEAG